MRVDFGFVFSEFVTWSLFAMACIYLLPAVMLKMLLLFSDSDVFLLENAFFLLKAFLNIYFAMFVVYSAVRLGWRFVSSLSRWVDAGGFDAFIYRVEAWAQAQEEIL